ncbi:MAG: hypothetical protein JXA04_10190 [Gammaproteobacteria bacterium]|nr:hypothetical protein [Gammaproteobacteria bacterium]
MAPHNILKMTGFGLLITVITACGGGGSDSDSSDSGSSSSSSTGGSTALCGNGQIDAGEACDGTNLGGYSCSAHARFASGTLACAGNCLGYDFSQCSEGNTITALSCSYDHVSSAVASANSGDIVRIPAGTCTWTSELTLNKGISIIGSGIDITTLVNNVPTSQGTSGQLLIDIRSTDAWRISNLTITDTGTNYDYDGHINIDAISNGWEIDHVKFIDSNYRHMFISKMAPGVIHDCIFENSTNQAMNIRTAGNHAEAADIWSTETHIGGADAIFLENNTFNNTVEARTAFDSEWGAKVVFRFNALTNSYWLNHGCENGRGAIWIEAYNNNITMTYSYLSSIQTRRGGTGVHFNNNIILDGGSPLWEEYVLNDYCAKGAVVNYSSGSQAPDVGTVLIGASSGETGTVVYVGNPSSGSWAGGDASGSLYVRPVSAPFQNGETVNIQNGSINILTAGTFTYNCCEWTINQEHCTEYPCLDQIGRTYNQILEPYYMWNNLIDQNQATYHIHDNQDGQAGAFTCADAIQKNRDYYEGAAGMQTSPTSPFDGTENVGWGTLTNRPTTCTSGVAYWATDEGTWNSLGEDGVLYKCSSTNNWIKHYTPYPYPHPLTQVED